MIKKILRYISKPLSQDLQDKGKRIFFKMERRMTAITQHRAILQGYRIVWPEPEIADYEKFEILTPAPYEVMVQASYTAVSPGTERAFLLNLPNGRKAFPLFPGYSGSGKILAVGKNVTNFARGDYVAGRLPHASVATVNPQFLFKVPANVNAEDAAFIELGIIALQGIRKLNVKPGESVLVIGQGLIGQLCSRLIRQSGAAPIVALARTPSKMSMSLAEGGSDYFFTLDQIQNSNYESYFDIVIEATGEPDTLKLACQYTRPGGRIGLLGSSRGLEALDFNQDVCARKLTLIGAHISGVPQADRRKGFWTYRDEGHLFVEMLKQNKLQVKDLISIRVDPFKADFFYRSLLKGKLDVVGSVFDWMNTNTSKNQVNKTAIGSINYDGQNMHRSLIPKILRSKRKSVKSDVFSTNKKLKIGIIGGGDIGLRNALSVNNSRMAQISAVFDANPDICRELAYRFSVNSMSSYEELLACTDVDAVLLSVPHHLHTPLGKQAAIAGKHVLVEKPLGVNLKAATDLIEVCQSTNTRLSPNFSFRYKPQIQLARQLIQEEVIGELIGIQVTHLILKGAGYWAGGYSARSLSDWRGSKEKAGGGILIMGVCHTLDYLRYITGLDIKSVLGDYGTFASPVEVEDAITLNCQYSNGAIGSVVASTCWRGQTLREDRIWGTEGSLVLHPDAIEFSSTRRWQDRAAGRRHILRSFANVDYTAEWIDRFADATLHNKPHEITGKDGWVNNAIIEAAYLSKNVGHKVEISTWPWTCADVP